MSSDLPNTAFVIFSSGAFGGAEKKITNLFLYLRKNYPGNIHFIINSIMKKHRKILKLISYVYTGGRNQ